MKKKLTLMIDRELVKQLKIFAVSNDITMTSLIEKAIANTISKGDEYNIEEITQKECEDITTVETVLPIKDLTEV